ncbi:OLC1v1013593C1 [Oldenlandia corymbosa var. corymbosa]|uniref:OLC1v1013593C1 n=1 Tax=Oldenlandia corymbosa var. corymbosa TaxID=529605 RepID=A0AAV1E1X6_OLDCO|nr:OLC1v1013593C1 [Oldenlandia corymbosa var. corymbosa]
MATSAFKSTTRRLSVAGGGAAGAGGDESFSSSSSSKATHRRSRSLSRFSRRLPSELEETPLDYRAAPKGKFVNTARGSEFPEISLDDLALEFFSSRENNSSDDKSCRNGRSNNDGEIKSRERGRSRDGRRDSDVARWASDTASSARRGRSVSRHREPAVQDKKVISHGSSVKAVNSEANSRRRRSLSVAQYRRSDSESDADPFRSSHSHYDVKKIDTWNGQVQKASSSADRRLRKSHSQRNLALLNDGYSSHSSALTDDDTKDCRSGNIRDEKTIRTVYQQKVGNPSEGVRRSEFYEEMRKELRYAVEEVRTKLEQAKVITDGTTDDDVSLGLGRSDGPRNLSAVRKSYTAKLEQSQKRKQELLAEMLLEDQHGRELSEIVKEFLPDSRNSSGVQKTSRTRKRSTDRSRMSNRLTEEAERYFEDFISNVEDTDISSFDGERSDGSSTLGGTIKSKVSTHLITENLQSPAESNLHTAEMDGVNLPWLQWETSNDGSLKEKNKSQTPMTPKTLNWGADKVISFVVVYFFNIIDVNPGMVLHAS